MRHGSWLRLTAIPLAFLLTACVETRPLVRPEAAATVNQPATAGSDEPAEVAALRHTAAMQDRLERVAGPLLVANADLCKRQARNLLGISARNKYSYSSRLAGPAERMFGLDERLQVVNVLPGSGADRAGVQRGDVLLAVEDKPVPRGANAESEAVALLAPLVARAQSVRLTVLRGNGEQSLSVPLTRACGFRVEIGNSDSVNSYSDGNRILVTRGLVRFARNDDELAYVVAKEMAHNVLGHAQLLKTTPAAANIIDQLVHAGPGAVDTSESLKPMPQQYDLAADTLSLHMAARAGHRIDQAPDFWQRLAAHYPANAAGCHTALHPASMARIAAMSKAIPRIKAAEEKRKASAAAGTPSS